MISEWQPLEYKQKLPHPFLLKSYCSLGQDRDNLKFDTLSGIPEAVGFNGSQLQKSNKIFNIHQLGSLFPLNYFQNIKQYV